MRSLLLRVRPPWAIFPVRRAARQLQYFFLLGPPSATVYSFTPTTCPQAFARAKPHPPPRFAGGNPGSSLVPSRCHHYPLANCSRTGPPGSPAKEWPAVLRLIVHSELMVGRRCPDPSCNTDTAPADLFHGRMPQPRPPLFSCSFTSCRLLTHSPARNSTLPVGHLLSVSAA